MPTKGENWMLLDTSRSPVQSEPLPASLVGSIGVAMRSFGFVGTLDRLGIERRLWTAGEHKSFLDPFSPTKPEDVEHLKGVLSQVHRQFVESRQEGQGRAPEGRSEPLQRARLDRRGGSRARARGPRQQQLCGPRGDRGRGDCRFHPQRAPSRTPVRWPRGGGGQGPGEERAGHTVIPWRTRVRGLVAGHRVWRASILST